MSLALVVAMLGASGRLAEYRENLRTLTVPSGLLDYGEKGKILKRLALVYGVRNPTSKASRYTGKRTHMGDSLFSKKREIGEYAYPANPGSTNQLPISLLVGKDQFRNGWSLISIAIVKMRCWIRLRGSFQIPTNAEWIGSEGPRPVFFNRMRFR